MTTSAEDPALAGFFAQNPDFDLLAYDFFARPAAQLALDGLDAESTLALLAAHQRLLRLGVRDASLARALIDAGMDSAHAIAARSQRRFLDEAHAHFEGDGAAARALHESATSLKEKLANLWATLHGVVASPHSRSHPFHNLAPEAAAYFEAFPSYRDLFGPLDYLVCPDCRSMLSPTAYFTDLMRVAQEYVTYPNRLTIPAGMKLEERRPDLFDLQLTCANAETIVPFLRLVDEVLVAMLAHHVLVPPLQALAVAAHPFNLPHAQPRERVRAALGVLGTSLAGVYETYPAPLTFGAARDGTSTSITLQASASALDDAYVGMSVEVGVGNAPAQTRAIVAYDGNTRLAAVAVPFASVPTVGSPYRVEDCLDADRERLGISLEQYRYLTHPDPAAAGVSRAYGYEDIGTRLLSFSPGPGTVTATAGSRVLEGTGTDFGSLAVGDRVLVVGEERTVVAIEGQRLTVQVAFTRNATDAAYQLARWPRGGAHVSIVGDSRRVLSATPIDGVAVGDQIQVAGEVRTVSARPSELELTVGTVWTRTADDVSFTYNPIDLLERVAVFLERTGLDRNALLELLGEQLSPGERAAGARALLFVNATEEPALPTLAVITDRLDPDAPYERLIGLSLARLERISRFVRLAAHIDAAYADVDWLVRLSSAGEIEAACVAAAAAALRLGTGPRQPLTTVASWWSEMRALGRVDDARPASPFDVVFNPAELIRGESPYESPQPIPFDPSRPLEWNIAQRALAGMDAVIRGRLRAALKLGDEELTALAGVVRANTGLATDRLLLDLPTLSWLYRIVSQARAFDLPLTQFLLLLRLIHHPDTALPSPGAIPATIAAAEQAAAAARWLAAAPLNAVELLYVITGEHASSFRPGYTDADLRKLVNGLAADAASARVAPVSLLSAGLAGEQGREIFDGLAKEQLLSQLGIVLERPATFALVAKLLALAPDAFLTSGLIDPDHSAAAYDGLVQRGILTPLETKKAELSQSFEEKTNLAWLFADEPRGEEMRAAVRSVLLLARTRIEGVLGVLGAAAAAQEGIAVQGIAGFLDVAQEMVAAAGELSLGRASLAPERHGLLTPLAPSELVPEVVRALVDRLARTCLWTTALAIEPASLRRIAAHPQPFAITSDVPRVPTLANLRTLASFAALASRAGGAGMLLDYLEAPTPSVLAYAMAWPVEQLEELIALLWPGAAGAAPGGPGTVAGVRLLAEAFDLAARTGTDPARLSVLLELRQLAVGSVGGSVEEAAWKRLEGIAEATFDWLAARYSASDLTGVSSDVEASADGALRDALVPFSIWTLARVAPQLGLRDADGLYEYLLLDVQMTPAASTTRIVQGISSVQLYLQRARANLEAGIEVVDIDPVWWRWLPSYRLWQANRTIFLYPENYLRPSPRSDQTPLFDDLVAELLQSEPGESSAVAALTGYFNDLARLANLSICGAYNHRLHRSSGDRDVLHLVARARTEPYEFFLRSRDEIEGWSPWRKVELSIASPSVALVVAFDRVFLFWAELSTSKSASVNQQENQSRLVTEDRSVAEAAIKFSFQGVDGRWVQPQVLAERVPTSVAPGDYPLLEDPTLEPYLEDSLFSYRQPYPLRVARGLVGTGRVTLQADSPNVHGTSTAFKRQVRVHDLIYCAGDTRTVEKVESDTELVCERSWSAAAAGAEFKVIPADLERNAFDPFPGAGLVSVFQGLPNVYGKGTSFATELAPGDRLVVAGESRTVRFISAADSLLVDHPWSAEHLDQQFRVIPGELGAERLIVLFGEPVPSTLQLALKPPTPTPNPGRDPFLTQREQYDRWVYAALLSAEATRNTKLRGVVTVSACNDLDVDLNARADSIRLLDYTVNCAQAPRPFRPVLDWRAATIHVARSDDALGDNYWGNGMAGVEARWPVAEGGFDLLFDVSRSHSLLTNVGNQPGWFMFDNGDESFLVTARQPQLGRLADMTFVRALGMSERDRAGLSLSAAPYTTAPVDFEGLLFAFARTSTSTIPQLQQRLLAGGVSGLLTLDAQRTPELPFSRFYLHPDQGSPPHVLPPSSDALDFDGAYGTYFQEVFLFTPWLVAERLRADQQYEAARNWLHYIFDPTARSEDGDDPKRFWRYLPFRKLDLRSIAAALGDKRQIAQYNDHPFDPDAIARLRGGAYAKAVVHSYLATLLDWADALFARDTRESIDQASQLYVLVSGLLGPRPAAVGTAKPSAPLTFRAIREHYHEEIPQFLIDLENASPEIASPPTQRYRGIPFNDVRSYFCVPENQELIGYWDRVEDRLHKIRNLLSLQGVPRALALYEAPIDVRRLGAEGGVPGDGGFAPPPNHRFATLIGQAREAAALVAQFGSALLGALERRDAEALAQLQARQQRELLEQTTLMKERQVDEAAAAGQALSASLAATVKRREHYDALLAEGLSSEEVENLNAMTAALVFNLLAQVASTAASIAYAIPQVGSPFAMTYGGVQIGSAVQAAGGALQGGSDISNYIALRSQTMAGYGRREQEWRLQAALAAIEEQQGAAELLANQARQAFALRDLEAHRSTIAQARAMESFLTSKFTNVQLYDWLVGRLGGLYFQLYQLAAEQAREAERAYQYELASGEKFVELAYWDRLRKGLLAGEALQLSLARMEQSYFARAARPLEIQRSISLLAIEPKALLDLRATGECTFALGERLFDLDFPGHYHRRIKSVAITIPAVFGPYQGISATLTQLGNQVVLEPDLETVEFLLGESTTVPSASRLRWNWRMNQRVALSRGVEDAGVFELSLEDQRYLPFEGTGAVSSWRLSLPPAANRFAFASIADVILDLRYTAEDGGADFRDKVTKLPALSEYDAEALLDLAQQYSDAWFAFMSDHLDPLRQALVFRAPATLVPPHLKDATLTGFTFLLLGPEVGADLAPSGDLEEPYIALTLTPEASIEFALGRGDVWSQSLDEPIPMHSLLEHEQSVAFALKRTPPELLKDGYLNPARVKDIALVLHITAKTTWR